MKNEGEETQYFNCSSSMVRCARLFCHIYNWPQDTNSATISFDMEVDLQAMGKTKLSWAVLCIWWESTAQCFDFSVFLYYLWINIEKYIATPLKPFLLHLHDCLCSYVCFFVLQFKTVSEYTAFDNLQKLRLTFKYL